MAHAYPPLWRIYQRFCKQLLSSYCSLQVNGLEHLPVSPYILCSNHCSHLDSPVLMLGTARPFHNFGMLAAKDYFFDQKRRRFLSLFMHLIPMERNLTRTIFTQNLAACKHFSEQNKIIILYPEGTRSKNGELHPLKKGAVSLSYHLNLPIVPAHIKGTFEAMPKGKRLIKPTKISLLFGAPLQINDGQLPSLRQATQELESTIKQLGKCHE
jgi:1-acyl-sn-glycerol-3-phosphate acyltransferase